MSSVETYSPENKVPAYIHSALRQYLSRVKQLSGGYVPSLFWEGLIQKFKSNHLQNLERASDAELEQIIRSFNSNAKMGYCFDDLPPSIPELAQWPIYKRALNRGRSMLALRRTLSPWLADRLASKSLWEHMYALQVLRELNLLEAYEQFISPLGIQSSMPVARHFFYKTKIQQLASQYLEKPLLDVCEIGAGAGNLAFFLHNSGIIRNYVIVDLPEVLILSAYTLRKYIPNARLVFADELDAISLSEEGQFVFVPAQNVDRLPNSTFDLCLNLNSFQEMDESARDHYIRTFYRVGGKNALFFNCNRRTRHLPQRDNVSFDNNPLLYPYADSDRVLTWEECPFNELARLRYNFCANIAIMRAALINPT